MTADITDCLTLLQSEMEAALVPTYANAVYGYRTGPDKLKKSVSLSYIGGAPGGSTTGGANVQFYDMVAVMGATTDGSEAELATAEQSLNDLENQLYLLLTNALKRTAYWSKVTFPTGSTRPPSFSFSPTTRYGELPFRLILL